MIPIPSLPNQMNTSAQAAPASCTSTDDTMSRHMYGVKENRKVSTGRGRAWNKEEEVYLFQTRLQKMPYKHIASYLKKSELACRLHYHQLSHGSNRRKRTSSVTSSSPGISSHSELPITAHSPIYEAVNMHPMVPPTNAYSPQSPPHAPLPAASTLSSSNSPRSINHPIAILPKPLSSRTESESVGGLPLRLDCDMAPSSTNLSNIDIKHLCRIYEAHRTSFWGQIAQEYGRRASPSILEEAWKGVPPTRSRHNSDTSISPLLGIDTRPTTLRERRLIKVMEEEANLGTYHDRKRVLVTNASASKHLR